MLQLRPNCECCNRDLPPESTEAMICTFECTFCRECVERVLGNVCQNCGGGFEKRPVRPATNWRGEFTRRPRRPAAKLAKNPASTERVYKAAGCGKAA
jgi:hypothetical protein